MDVAQLMKLIEVRQGDLSDEMFAKRFDFSGTTLFRWKKGERQPNLKNVRSMAKHFESVGDTEMVNALREYALFGGTTSSH